MDRRGGGSWTKSKSIFLYIKGNLFGEKLCNEEVYAIFWRRKGLFRVGPLKVNLVGFWIEIGGNFVRSWLVNLRSIF